jgi:probable rRNA maturation factor
MIDVEIEDEAWTTALPDVQALTARAVLGALTFESKAVDGLEAQPADETVTVLLTDDEAVRELNAQFRGKDSATNVLSFPAAESAYPHLGDIALAYGVCVREAEAQGKPLAHHLFHLAVHGTLHLLGYDHLADAEAEAMEAMERAILAGFDIADPYLDRDAPGHEGTLDHG